MSRCISVATGCATKRAGLAISICFALALLYPGAASAAAAASTSPERVSLTTLKSGPFVLTVGSGPAARRFSLAQIEALGTYRVRTSTFWPADDGIYEGVLLADLLRAAGLGAAKNVRVVALDGYSQVLPREDWTRWPLMIATRHNGKPLSRRDKGPLRVVYPRSSDPRLADQSYRLRWVWMIQKIVVANK